MRVSPHGPKPDWTAMETAFEHNAPETHSYLDLKTGQVATIVDSRPEDDEKRQLIRRSEGRFVHLDPASSREQYRWMERFVQSVADDALRERLILAIDGKGAFRRFKDVLLSYPVERDRWFTYRGNLLHIYINGWLEAQDILLGEEPPWGIPDQPPEPDIPLEKPIGQRGEGPTETLRRQARELVDTLPALELPALIAYIRFLSDRAPSVVEGAERPE
ncbi:MAG: hypothetical protein IPH07_02575 [Deltaproteobacteria bacterium]|nr:hypothetical protein [Deltaproteobacteria bacterium]MBK8238103.1 hypothetical protein [Deltaproteobacteria bacterium]MBK8718552.1 hypothetical protein [Deltaproteobacteria bacterium]MBP7290811.1 hypothetical protein [Nannocystaceae bacterium]